MNLLEKGYGAGELRGDVAAGITTAVLLVPQAVAYAMLAVPVAAYALTGSSRYLSVGPVAVVSLLVASTLADLTAPPGDAVSISILLALMSGIMLLLLGLARGGIIDNFLSHTVIKGYTAAAALIISLSQLRNLSGIPRRTSTLPG